MPDIFDGISDWLLSLALTDSDASDILAELARRLVDGGVPINRINIGRPILHPIIGLFNLKWEADSNIVTSFTVPRKDVSFDILANSPFGDLVTQTCTSIHADLRNPDEVARYEIFGELVEEGVTGYAAFGRAFGFRSEVLENIAENFRGAVISFSTRRFSGFSQAEIEGLERLVTPFFICLRIATERFLATELLETYLGRNSGKRVLTGHSARGDVQTIECALLSSDMRNSVGLSQQLDAGEFLDCINQYFDCTAGAVLEHGGEVLKFIGDGVLAIFPFDDLTRPRPSMCAAALSTAREAFARADHVNAQRKDAGLVPFDFGMALHVGKVIYGNVGTEKRLDFTATGPAVGLVSRCESLTRDLGERLIATRGFADECTEDSRSLGSHSLKGFGEEVTLVTYPVAG